MSTATITADKAAVEAEAAKVKADMAAGGTTTLATDKAAQEAARQQMATDRTAALSAPTQWLQTKWLCTRQAVLSSN